MKKGDFVQIVQTNGNYRYGYIEQMTARGYILTISLYDEGESKLAFDAEAGSPIPDLSSLTKHEKRIIPLLAEGLSTNEMSERLEISPITIRAYLRTMRIKLHLDDRFQLRALAPALQRVLDEAPNGT